MSPSLKLAALRLRALHPSDRDWLLVRLAPAQREPLQRALAELEPLLAAAPGLDAEAAYRQARNAHDLNAMLEAPPQWHAALDAMSPAWAVLALHGAAPELYRGYLKHCDAERRQALTRAEAALPKDLPPALARFVRAAAQPDADLPSGFVDALRRAPLLALAPETSPT